MPRYVRMPARAAVDWPLFPERHSVTVHCAEPVDTGLLFPDGQRVMRAPDPIGFLSTRERD